MKRVLSFFVFCLVLAGCASLGPVASMIIERPAFPEGEYAALEKSGTGVVTGQAFLRTVGGDVKYAAGSNVLLNPVTSYSEFWYEHNYKSRMPNSTLSPADPRQAQYQIVTQADGGGNFRFENVPPGDYYLTTLVTWGVPQGSYARIEQQGGFISERITVENGKETRKILTR